MRRSKTSVVMRRRHSSRNSKQTKLKRLKSFRAVKPFTISQLLALTKRLYFSETSSMTLSDSLQNEVHKRLERRVAIILSNEETPFSGESLGYQPFSHNRWLENIRIC